MTSYSRRDFNKMMVNALLTASGLLGFGGLIRYLGYSTEPPSPTEFDLGAASDYPIGSRTVLSEVPALLIHEDSGFTALSLVCPHLGCTVQDNQNGLVCPCHGSHFGSEGTLLGGPATQPLRSLRLEITDDDHIRLFLS